MKVRDVPQDPGSHLPKGFMLYAVDDEGHYQSVLSVGNDLGTLSTKMLWEYLNEQVDAAAERVRSGQESPLAFYMARKIVDCGLLSKYVGMARWRIKRHLRPAVFKGLKPSILRRYADFFGVSVEEFASPSLENREILLHRKED